MTYQFVPSAANNSYLYRISFTNSAGTTLAFDADYSGGMCTGTAPLSPDGTYSVTATVSNGVEERAAPLARELRIDDNHVSWIPCAP